jgi:hypothetical protein
MFVKHSNLMLNLLKLHIKLEDEYLKFYENFTGKPVHAVKFKDAKTASFAYGRVIHAVLLHWGAVDITEHVINNLMEKKLSATELPEDE